mmetsp:Transcript_34567/g.108352  ORF Transcript_34567/g.108352 Transcript_34567/m.108352 type:complete len:129 (-) Transcript_34567:223-609(-)
MMNCNASQQQLQALLRCCVLFCLSVPFLNVKQSVLPHLDLSFSSPDLTASLWQRRASAICGGVEEDGHHRHRRDLHRRETARRAAGANQVSGKTNHTVLQAGRRESEALKKRSYGGRRTELREDGVGE